MLRRSIGVAAAVVVTASLTLVSGCSSSSGASTVDSGGNSSSRSDASATHRDAGKPRKDSSTRDAGTRADSTSLFQDASADSAPADHDASPSADAGTTCSPQGTWSFGGLTYVPTVGHQGACTKLQIAAFVKACGRLGTAATCAAWMTAQVKADGAGTCGDCIVAPGNNGAVWFDPAGVMSANYAGCIQLMESTDGGTCAAAYDNAAGCDGVACDMACREASDPDAWVQCTDTANAKGTGSCAAWVTAQAAACAPDLGDGGAMKTCFPSSASGNVNNDLTYIATLICGT